MGGTYGRYDQRTKNLPKKRQKKEPAVSRWLRFNDMVNHFVP